MARERERERERGRGVQDREIKRCALSGARERERERIETDRGI